MRERDFAFGVARQLFEQPVAAWRAKRSAQALLAGAAGLSGRLVGDAGPEVVAQGADTAFGGAPRAVLADRQPGRPRTAGARCGRRALGRRRVNAVPRLPRAPDRGPAGAAARRGTSRRPRTARSSGASSRATRPPRSCARARLSEPAVAQLLRSRLGTEVDGTFSAACHEATGGNPLFLRELVAALDAAEVEPSARRRGRRCRDGGTARRRALRAAAARAARRARHRAGAHGRRPRRRRATFRSPRARPDSSPDEARSVADLLVRADVLAADRELGFVHPIVEAAIYEDLLPGERAARHAAAARLLADSGAPAERVATHLLQTDPAGDPAAVTTLREAGGERRRARRAGRRDRLSAARSRRAARRGRAGGACSPTSAAGRPCASTTEAAEEHLLAALDAPGRSHRACPRGDLAEPRGDHVRPAARPRKERSRHCSTSATRSTARPRSSSRPRP